MNEWMNEWMRIESDFHSIMQLANTSNAMAMLSSITSCKEKVIVVDEWMIVHVRHPSLESPQALGMKGCHHIELSNSTGNYNLAPFSSYLNCSCPITRRCQTGDQWNSVYSRKPDVAVRQQRSIHLAERAISSNTSEHGHSGVVPVRPLYLLNRSQRLSQCKVSNVVLCESVRSSIRAVTMHLIVRSFLYHSSLCWQW